MGTRSRARSKAKCVLVDSSSDSEAAESEGSEEKCSVQGDREDECFSGVCKVNTGQNWSQKYGLNVVIVKLGIIPLVWRWNILCVLNALEREEMVNL